MYSLKWFSLWKCKGCFMTDGEAILLVSTLFPWQPAVSGFIKYFDTGRGPCLPTCWSPCLWRRRYPQENVACFITWNNDPETRRDLGQLAFDTFAGDFVIAWVFLWLELNYPDHSTRDGAALLSFSGQKIFSKTLGSQDLSRNTFNCIVIKSFCGFVLKRQ